MTCDLHGSKEILHNSCALCERDLAFGELAAFQEAILAVQVTLWNAIYAKAREISEQNPLFGSTIRKRANAYPKLVEALRQTANKYPDFAAGREAAALLRELGEAE